MSIKLGDIIASGLEFKGIKQKQMAKDLGIQYSTFNNYVCNTREPDFETMIRIFRYLDIDLNAVFQLTPNDNNYSITKDEARLLKIYRSVPPNMKKRMIAINDNIANIANMTKDEQ